MKWKNPDNELPKKGDIVAILIKKIYGEEWPLNCQIHFGEVWNIETTNELFVKTFYQTIGVPKDEKSPYGWASFKPKQHFGLAIAWEYANEFEKPEFLK